MGHYYYHYWKNKYNLGYYNNKRIKECLEAEERVE